MKILQISADTEVLLAVTLQSCVNLFANYLFVPLKTTISHWTLEQTGYISELDPDIYSIATVRQRHKVPAFHKSDHCY